MKKALIVFVLICTSALLYGQDGDVKEGWSFVPFPDISYNSDIGLNMGGFCDFFYYGEGADNTYPNFKHHIATTAAWATKGVWYVHTMAESKTLVPGIRLTGSLTYRNATMNTFYGFNGIASPYDATLDQNAKTRTAWYTTHRQLFRAVAGAQGPIYGRLNWTAGAVFRQIGIDDFSLKNYDSGNSLFLNYVASGLIRADESVGGISAEVRAGLIYDTRDIEWVPNKGFYAEAYVNANKDLSHGHYDYLQLVAHWKQFIPIVYSRLTFAYHLGLQHCLAGEMPFYNLSELSALAYQYEENEGMGGRFTIRGFRYKRFLAQGFAWANFELRARVLDFGLLGNSCSLVVNPFFDMGTITKTYRLDEQKALGPVFYQERSLPVAMSAGCGLKYQMNTNFILSIEVAKGFDPQLSELTVSMSSTYAF